MKYWSHYSGLFAGTWKWSWQNFGDSNNGVIPGKIRVKWVCPIQRSYCMSHSIPKDILFVKYISKDFENLSMTPAGWLESCQKG